MDGPVLAIENGDLLGQGFNYIVVLTSSSVHVYGQPGLNKTELRRLQIMAKEQADLASGQATLVQLS